MNKHIEALLAKLSFNQKKGTAPKKDQSNLPEWKKKSRENRQIHEVIGDPNTIHVGAISGKKIYRPRKSFKTGRPIKRDLYLTNSQRVIANRMMAAERK